MCNFKVNNGTFSVSQYETKSKDRGLDKIFSCSIYIEFTPENTENMQEGDRICLVQAVQDNIIYDTLEKRENEAKVIEPAPISTPIRKLIPRNNVDQNEAAEFRERMTDNNWAIDQVLYQIITVKIKRLINLDPRYVEQRLLSGSYRDHSDTTKVKKGSIGYSQNYKHGDTALTTAILSDEPTAIYSFSAIRIPYGKERFEVVAMLDKVDGSKEYLASLSWGWKLERGEFKKNRSGEPIYVSQLETINLSASDKPSQDFFEAAKEWNNMIKRKQQELTDAKKQVGILPEKS